MGINNLSSISTLFSNSYQSNSNNNSMMNLYSAFSEYSTIRSGAYRKLVKAYYNEADTSSTNSTSSSNKVNQTSEETKQYTQIRSASDTLSKSASVLLNKGTKSLFSEVEKKKVDETTGKETTVKEYDMKAIKDAVNSFIKEYNNTIEVASETDNHSVLRSTLNLTKQTAAYAKTLDKIGITIKDDNTLSIDEAKFEASEMSYIKSVFNGNQSFASKTLYQSTQIAQNAVKAASSQSLYSKSGTYSTTNYYSANNWYL